MTFTQKLQMDLLLSYRQLNRELRVAFANAASQNELTELQALILKALHTNDNVSLSELSGAVLCSEGQASTVIEQLVHMGLVSRERSTEDRRRITLEVTESGQTRLQMMFGPHSRLLDVMTHVFALPQHDLEYLIRMNQTIIQNLQVEGVK